MTAKVIVTIGSDEITQYRTDWEESHPGEEITDEVIITNLVEQVYANEDDYLHEDETEVIIW